jgi:flagellar biogenesis protein FliO
MPISASWVMSRLGRVLSSRSVRVSELLRLHAGTSVSARKRAVTNGSP